MLVYPRGAEVHLAGCQQACPPERAVAYDLPEEPFTLQEESWRTQREHKPVGKCGQECVKQLGGRSLEQGSGLNGLRLCGRVHRELSHKWTSQARPRFGKVVITGNGGRLSPRAHC